MRIALVVAAATLVACGSKSDSPNGGVSSPVSGAIAGTSFTPTDSAAIVVDPTRCNIEGALASALRGMDAGVQETDADGGVQDVNTSLTTLVIAFSNFPQLCAFMQQTQGCELKANASIASLIVFRAAVGSTGSPIAPGTYPVGLPQLTADWAFSFAAGMASQTDAQCQSSSGSNVSASGSITIDAVSSTDVTGSVDLTYLDGSHLSGSFTAPICHTQLDSCGLINTTGTGTGGGVNLDGGASVDSIITDFIDALTCQNPTCVN
jgi:hypothetical protein